MKDSQPSTQNKSKESPAHEAIGGQPESDQEAREAGLQSATSGESASQKGTSDEKSEDSQSQGKKD